MQGKGELYQIPFLARPAHPRPASWPPTCSGEVPFVCCCGNMVFVVIGGGGVKMY